MSSTLAEHLTNFIDEKCVPEDEDKELIKINTRYTKAKYYDSEELKFAVFNYIINKERADDDLTDINNNFQVIKAMNVLYHDGDWIWRNGINSARYDSLATELMDLYMNSWCDELRANNFDNNYYFEFIPNEYPNKKGGFHVFIYVDRNVSVEKRIEMYNNVKNKLIHSDEFIKCAEMFQFAPKEDPEQAIQSNTFYEKLFDPQPLKSCQCLIPFAQKDHSSRRYKLIDKSFDSSNVPDYFVIPIQHRQYEVSIEDSIGTVNETKIYDDGNEDLDEMLNKLKQTEKFEFKDLGRVGKITAEFMLSLRYLSKKHMFWQKLKEHDTKLKKITRDLIGFILVNHFIEKRGDAPKNDRGQFYESIARILHPLLKLTVINTNENTERDKFSSLYNNIKNYYDKYTDVSCDPQHNNNGGLFSNTHAAFWREYLTMSPREKHALDPESFKKLTTIKYYFQKYYSNWFRFLKEMLLDGMTDEIRPFEETSVLTDDPREGVVFDQVMKEQPSVNNKARIEDSFYIKTFRKWCRMFIVEEVYNTKSIQEAIRSILTAFCRYYIWYSKNQAGNERLYVYNIRQTKMLLSYPYNQWLLDGKDGDLLKDWIKTMYLTFLKPELLTINIAVSIKPILDNLKVAEIVDNVALERNIKPLGDFDKGMDNAYKNIISSFATEHNDPPKELNPVSSSWFPMRNGLLEFVENGEVHFHVNNLSRFMNAYTNIIWDEKYNYNCDEFKKVQTMWEQIFPIKEERDYCLAVFASSMNGMILKDVLIIQYGEGGDGKTVSNNAIMGMLGCDGFTSFSNIEENGKNNYVENPSGLATTMKTETILVSQKSNHDEGGIVMMKNKRFCTVQEPDPNLSNGYLNCSRIKEILSGTTVTARQIYKAAESFTPNSVLTLQTNVLLGYSEDTDAIRRRITVVPYRSKFTTQIQGDKYDTLKYKFAADPQLSLNLVQNPKYWQALFYSLLPYAKQLTKQRVKALSDIVRPRSIINETNKSFMRSNGLVGWLATNVKESPGHIICVSRFRKVIEDANTNEIICKRGPILNGKKPHEKANEIFAQIGQTYMGRVYRLKSKYYNESRSALKDNTIDEQTINDSVERDGKTKMEVQNEIIRNWFKPNAINNLSFSRLMEKNDLFIVGYQFASEMSEEDLIECKTIEHEPKNSITSESKDEHEHKEEKESKQSSKEKNINDEAAEFL